MFDSLGTKSASLAIAPCATVFSTSGRSDRPSGKKSERESGRFLGWSAMSWRRYWQPLTKTRHAAAHAMSRKRRVLVIRHLGDMVRVKLLEQARRFCEMEFRIFALDADKKTV